MSTCHWTLNKLIVLHALLEGASPELVKLVDHKIEIAKRIGGPICGYVADYPEIAALLGYPDDGHCIHPELGHFESDKCPLGAGICAVMTLINTSRQRRGLRTI